MNEKPVKPIPNTGSWIQNVNERAILYVSEVDPVKERFRIKRFAGHGAEGPEFAGRTTWLSYETYRKGSRYMPREAPLNPDNLPEKITREQAQEALELEGWSTTAAFEALDDAARRADDVIGRPSAILRAYLGKPAPTVTPPDGMPVTEETLTREQAEERLRQYVADERAIEVLLRRPGPCSQVSPPPIAAILLAYERGQSASKIVNGTDHYLTSDVPAAQPTIADVLAAIEALRAEVRADHKPLLDAVDRVLGNHGPYGSESDVVEVHLDAFKALRAARAKVA